MTVVGEEFFQGMTVGVTISSVVDVVVAGVKTMICDIEAVTVSDFIPEWQLRAIGELWDDYVGEWRCGINMAISSIVPQERNRNSQPALFCMPNLKRRVRNYGPPRKPRS